MIAIAVVVGLVVGRLATFVVEESRSVLRYIVFGIIGAVVGNFLFSIFNAHLQAVCKSKGNVGPRAPS
jgi:uncharacterized membrane protein YeaQ/YmgE (transglycosylase-associated protein family)